MNDETEYTFKTKTGACVVSPDKLVLHREGTVGPVAKFMWGKSVFRGLVIYGILGLGALALGVTLLVNGHFVYGILVLITGAYLLWNVIASRNNSSAGLIERSTLRSVDVQPPNPPFTRGYFVIHFLQKGRERKRLVMLPGLSGGDDEYPKALAAMRKTGWLQD
jgi:hypothetical protein